MITAQIGAYSSQGAGYGPGGQASSGTAITMRISQTQDIVDISQAARNAASSAASSATSVNVATSASAAGPSGATSSTAASIQTATQTETTTAESSPAPGGLQSPGSLINIMV